MKKSEKMKQKNIQFDNDGEPLPLSMSIMLKEDYARLWRQMLIQIPFVEGNTALLKKLIRDYAENQGLQDFKNLSEKKEEDEEPVQD